MLAQDTILQQRYRIVRTLGQGGLGVVYEAVDQRIACRVALKETLAAGNVEARRAFEREASLLGNLHDRALPKVMDFFSEGDGDFLVMEYISGYNFAELLKARGTPFPQEQVLLWADELLRVLVYLHGQKPAILHRDIKPANLKLTKEGEIFLLDFGLAKGHVGPDATLATEPSFHGYTKAYAPIEQINGHGTDPRSDLYSLGATLYHLVTGIRPKDAPERSGAIKEQKPDPLKPIETLNAQISLNVARVIQNALAINRKDRTISASEMRKELRRAVDEDNRIAAEEAYRRADEEGEAEPEHHSSPEFNLEETETTLKLPNESTPSAPKNGDNEDELTHVAPSSRHRFEVPLDGNLKSDEEDAKEQTEKQFTLRERWANFTGVKRLLILGVLVTVIGLLVLAGYEMRARSLERRLDEAIAGGNLFGPTGTNAHDLFNQLKESGASPDKLSLYRDKLLPQLTRRPLDLINQFSIPGTDDPPLADWESSAQALGWAAELKPSDQTIMARAYYCQGRVAYLKKQEDQALPLWLKAADADKTWPLPPNGVGLIFFARKDYKTARRHYFEAIRRDSKWAVPYNNLGTSFYFEVDFESAKENYRKAVQLAPRWARPHAWLGDIASRQKNNDEAQAQYEAVLAADAVGTATLDLPKIRSELEKARNASVVVQPSPSP